MRRLLSLLAVLLGACGGPTSIEPVVDDAGSPAPVAICSAEDAAAKAPCLLPPGVGFCDNGKRLADAATSLAASLRGLSSFGGPSKHDADLLVRHQEARKQRRAKAKRDRGAR